MSSTVGSIKLRNIEPPKICKTVLTPIINYSFTLTNIYKNLDTNFNKMAETKNKKRLFL